MATRRTVQDFIAAVNAQTPGSVSGATYAGTLNTDGTVQITRNSVVLWPKVYWFMGPGSAKTDANQGDSIRAWGLDAAIASGDAQAFLNTLN